MEIKLINTNYQDTNDYIYSIDDGERVVAVRVDALNREVMPHDFEPTLAMLLEFQSFTGDDASDWIKTKKADILTK
mgnify:CR=1 FL=1